MTWPMWIVAWIAVSFVAACAAGRLMRGVAERYDWPPYIDDDAIEAEAWERLLRTVREVDGGDAA